MQNWSSDENEAMRGYILYAADMCDDMPKDALNELMRKLYLATDDMTANEAREYYIKHS